MFLDPPEVYPLTAKDPGFRIHTLEDHLELHIMPWTWAIRLNKSLDCRRGAGGTTQSRGFPCCHEAQEGVLTWEDSSGPGPSSPVRCSSYHVRFISLGKASAILRTWKKLQRSLCPTPFLYMETILSKILCIIKKTQDRPIPKILSWNKVGSLTFIFYPWPPKLTKM